jgi:hypothetical protein
MAQKLIGKILPELSEEDAIELAEVATGIKNSWYYAGKDNSRIIISSLDGDKEFNIYYLNRRFDYVNLLLEYSYTFNAIELVDKLRELGYELNTEEND